jgi:ribosomal protein S18 acetylase RimI-like enzyme
MWEEGEKSIVRYGTPDDFDRCLPLFKGLYHGDIGHNFKEIFDSFTRSERDCVLITEQQGKVVGILVGSYHLDIDWEGKVARIQALVVEKKHRNKGIGKKLVHHFLHKAKKEGCCAVRSRVNRRNQVACSFHERLGFEKARTYEYILEF